MCVSDLCHSSTVNFPPAGGILGSGFALQAAFWYQNAMLALFLHGKKSLKRSLRLLPPFRTPHII